jgi:hypothetical protein
MTATAREKCVIKFGKNSKLRSTTVSGVVASSEIDLVVEVGVPDLGDLAQDVQRVRVPHDQLRARVDF